MNSKIRIRVEVISGKGGLCIALNNYRICGEKPWGGGKVINEWMVDIDRIKDQINTVEAEEKNATCEAELRNVT